MTRSAESSSSFSRALTRKGWSGMSSVFPSVLPLFFHSHAHQIPAALMPLLLPLRTGICFVFISDRKVFFLQISFSGIALITVIIHSISFAGATSDEMPRDLTPLPSVPVAAHSSCGEIGC
jgi:hypothetical protein